MDPQAQVNEIIILMNPENPGNQTDAVFLVLKYMEKMSAKVAALEKQLAKAEAKVVMEQQLRSNIENEKLVAENRLKAEKKKIMDEMGIQPTPPNNPGPGGGRTL